MAAAVSRFFDSDLWWSFRRSPTAVLSALVALLCIGGAVLAPWIAPQDPFDLATLNLIDAFKPPAWAEEGDAAFPLGSDDQGRDVLSAVLYRSMLSGVDNAAINAGAGSRGAAATTAAVCLPIYGLIYPVPDPSGCWRATSAARRTRC